MSILPLIQRAFAGERVEGFPMTFPPPIAVTIGFEPVAIERGGSVFRLDVKREKHANPMGTVHGGVLVDVSDAAMGIACASLLEQGESFTTVELQITYFRPVINGTIEARAKVVNSGKTLVYLECDIVSLPEEKLIAKTSSTCLILRGDQAKGRGGA
jgi:uncharacterized protein (TIGR00369 family)